MDTSQDESSPWTPRRSLRRKSRPLLRYESADATGSECPSSHSSTIYSEYVDSSEEDTSGDGSFEDISATTLPGVLDATPLDDGPTIDTTEDTVNGFREDFRLLPHQVIGRVWMRQREDGDNRGGLLADDMGLGKTIQVLVRIVDGNRAMRSASGEAVATLIVCPLALIQQWASEIRSMVKKCSVIEYHGSSRISDPAQLSAVDVVITSYNVVASEYGQLMKPHKTAKSALFDVHWRRIVLDEAHSIKNKETQSAKGCCGLQATYRWCLTGTPIQNSLEEMFSLISFLRTSPLADWQTFNAQVGRPARKGDKQTAVKNLRAVLEHIMLRRLKTHKLGGEPIVDLPSRTVEVIPCVFNAEERAFYTALRQNLVERFAQGPSNFAMAMVMLLRLRQACDHNYLVMKRGNLDMAAVTTDLDIDRATANTMQRLDDSTAATCQICLKDLTEATNVDRRQRSEYCAACKILVSRVQRFDPTSSTQRPPSSAKIRKIIELLKDIDTRSNGAEKTIIFSQFTSMLNLIHLFLVEEGIVHVRYDGAMTPQQRRAALDALENNALARCILVSFKAGSTGLNLTACNNVILVDMWWNPALEDQAFDRAHRVGQTRHVRIYKLTIQDTVEEHILKVREVLLLRSWYSH
ncbi:hypothetical protein PLICRDRAFT_106737 [Plicaturopsis crispa FD-325 SS-3]|nr:hypothetical protein PLICRDRAFT_106737 [Plicaturopsis crispa FD-325 SS-3]